MYDKSDPRSLLPATASIDSGKLSRSGDAQFVEFHHVLPAATAGARTWFARGQNFVIAYTEGSAGAIMGRPAQIDEYALLLDQPGSGVAVRWGEERLRVSGPSVTFIPAGNSEIVLSSDIRLTRMFTSRSEDLTGLCSNAAAYVTPQPNLPPFEPWPTAVGGDRIRSYSLDVSPTAGRFGRIYRCSTFMINVLDPKLGPRDVTKMSPHSHEDFEQCSLALEGRFVHHLRWPWTVDMNAWRDDRHVTLDTPSVAVIPPRIIHTSQALSPGVNVLVDVFCPPRRDFSAKPGWVLNADDYPAPPS